MSDMEIKVCLEEANVNKDFFTPNCKENNHKCPVCQNNLHKINIVVSTCTNDKCRLWGSSIPNLVLEALTQAKQDLEIATKALEKYADEDMWENCCIWDIEYIQGLFLEHGYKIAKEALEQIEHKE